MNAEAPPRACRVCGCSEARACVDLFGDPCHWAGPDLCSACLREIEPYRGVFRGAFSRAAFAGAGAVGFIRRRLSAARATVSARTT